MAQPTQVLPSWLTASTSIFTVGGVATTSTTVLQLPLTYYGPSIPLGTDGVWTYGGSISPASSPTPSASASLSSPTASPSPSLSTTSAIPSPSATSTPTSTSPTFTSPSPTSTSPSPTSTSPAPTSTSPSSLSSPSSSSATSSSPSSLSSTSSSSSTSGPIPAPVPSTSSTTPFSSSATSSPSSAPVPAVAGLSQDVKLAVTLGVIFGSLGLLTLLLGCLIWRRHRAISGAQYAQMKDAPAGAEAAREPGEGSPRASGDEAASFLRASRSGQGAMSETTPVRLVRTPTSTGAAAVTAGTVSDRSSTSSYGNLLESQDIGTALSVWPQPPVRRVESAPVVQKAGQPQIPTIHEDVTGSSRRTSMRGHVVSPSWNLGRIENEEQQSGSGSDGVTASPETLKERTVRHVESAPSIPEGYSPLVPPPRLTRHLLQTPQLQQQSTPNRSSFAPSTDEPLNTEVLTARRAEFLMAREVRVEDLPKSPTSPSEDLPSTSRGRLSSGFGRLSQLSWFKNLRPPSRRTSAGASQYSKASSRPASYLGRGLSEGDLEAGQALLEKSPDQPSDTRPISTVSGKSVASTVYHDAPEEPSPSTPTSAPPLPPLPQAYFATGRSQTPSQEPPAYDDSPPQGPPASNVPEEVDVLDIPAPLPASPFGSSSSKSGRSGSDRLVYPPGLGLPTPRVWDTPSTGRSSEDYGVGITVDILEDEPPAAAGHWRSLAQSVNVLEGDARSFGLPTYIHVHAPGTSEEASLHSMRSHLSPNSARSTGSAPASSRRAFSSSIGSGSSGRGGHSADRSASSMSLRHSSSFSSDPRRRRALSPISPALSAFGRHTPSDGGGSAYLPAMRPLSPLGLSADDTVTQSNFGGSTGSATVINSPSPAAVSLACEDRWITATPGLRWVNPMHSRSRELDTSE